MITRRNVVLSTALIGLAWTGRSAAATPRDSIENVLGRIERDSGGRLGVAVLDTGSIPTSHPSSGLSAGHRADERFPMCSTFKFLACAAVLKRVDNGQEMLGRRIRIGASDVVPNSTFIKAPVGGNGMTLAEICEAAITRSDNTAANLILRSLGGPPAVTAFARSIGDPVTRLDRTEPTLHEATPGDPRDTTPAAMLNDMHRLLLGEVLSAASKAQLTAWLVGNKTGDTRLRAGLPGWRVGDKTGTGDHGTANDIGIAWPPGRKPILVTVYLTGTSTSAEQRSAAIAAVGRAAAAALGK
jgi:beta-lactamase class A